MFRGEFHERLRLFGVLEVAEILLVGVRTDECGHHREKSVTLHPVDEFRIAFVIFGDMPFGELIRERFDQFIFEFRVRVVGAREFVCLVAPLFKRFEIREHEFRQNYIEVVHRIDPAVDMDDVAILEEPHHVRDRVDVADVAEKLIAEPLSLARAFHKSGDVDELQRGGDDSSGLLQFGEHPEPLIRNRHDSGVRLDRAERKVGRFGAALAQRVEQSGFADIRQSDESTGKTHDLLSRLMRMFPRF